MIVYENTAPDAVVWTVVHDTLSALVCTLNASAGRSGSVHLTSIVDVVVATTSHEKPPPIIGDTRPRSLFVAAEDRSQVRFLFIVT